MRIVCVKWGDKYGPEWVYRLRAAVRYWFKAEHEFVCMTDKPIGDVDCIPCAPDLPTWWSKVGLFQPGLFPGKNLYLDLDVVLTDEITGLADEFQPGKVVAPDDFSYSLLSPRQGLGPDMQRLLGGAGTVNSSVMLWRGDDGRDVWDQFQPQKMDEVHGDQNWITQCLWPAKLGLLSAGWVCSYKYHVERGAPTMPIVVFHGNPKPSDLGKFHPLRKAWTGSLYTANRE